MRTLYLRVEASQSAAGAVGYVMPGLTGTTLAGTQIMALFG